MSPDTHVPRLVRPAVARADTPSTAEAAAPVPSAAPRERVRLALALRLVVAIAVVEGARWFQLDAFAPGRRPVGSQAAS